MDSARILIIEPDARIGGELTTALEDAGYVTAWTVDILEGLRTIQEMRPDLIIMTSGLPTVKGEDPCLRVRQASYLPIILMGREEETADLLDLGADAFVVKPPDKREMLARIRTLLRRKWQPSPPGPDMTGMAFEEWENRRKGTSR